MDLKKVRKFERFLFHGVPDGPEPSFERDSYSHFKERSTGQSTKSAQNKLNLDGAILLGYILDDFENKVEILIPVEEHQD